MSSKPYDASHRNGAVKRVLLAAGKAITSSEIAREIREPWCMYAGDYENTAAISPVCRRIGAISVSRGKWAADPKWEAA